MDPNVSLSAMLASVAGGADPSMILANTNHFGTQQVNSSTHNQQVKAPFFLNHQNLSAVLAAAANSRFDNQFSATSPPNTFIAASPLSSISSSLSSANTDSSPISFASLSTLSPTNLQQLNKLISPNIPDVIDSSPNTTSNLSTLENPVEVLQNLQKLRGLLVPNISSTNTPAANYSPMISQNDSYNNDLEGERQDENSTGPRRIRRRRPKSPRASDAKKPNIAVEIKQEEVQQMITDDEVAITLSNSPMDSAMTPGASDSFNSNDCEGDGQLSASQKICRVCGDHATGYNFNVISCESCKAFFRRNALRPKEFKCPYSGDCEINAVSRRFCQLCRLQKCVRVGMKKEWILNDEQLKRRKNSRLNSLKSVNSNASNEPLSPPQQFQTQQPTSQHQNVSQPNPLLTLPQLSSLIPRNVEKLVKREPKEQQFISQINTCQPSPQPVNQQQQSAFTSPLQLSANFANNQYENNNNVALQQLLNAANQQKSPNFMPLLSQYNRLTMDSLSGIGGMNQFGEKPIEQSSGFEPIIQQHQQQQMEINLPMRPNLRQMQNVSTEDYNQMVQTTQSSSNFQSYNLPPTSLQSGFSELPINVEASSIPTNTMNYEQNSLQNMGGSPMDSPQPGSSQLSSPNANSFMFPPFLDWSPATFRVMEEAIQDQFEACSPENFADDVLQIEFKETSQGDTKMNYQLNSSELCELDVVRNAYSCMDEKVNDSKDTETWKKKDHSITDVMNMIDIIMRRFVKMTKKLPAFNQISQEGKLALLKCAMIKMVTMRGVTRFDPKRLCWSSSTLNRVNVSCHIFDKLNDTFQKSKFIQFCHSIHDVIRRNDMVINLVGLLILFGNTSSMKNEEDKVKSKEYHGLYSNLLRRYLESVHGHEAGPIVDSIPVMLDSLDNIGTVAETIFIGKVESNDTRKLPLEFFKTRADELPANSIVNGSNQPTSSA